MKGKMGNKRRRVGSLLVATALAMAVFSGCGSGTGASSPSSEAPSSTGPSPSSAQGESGGDVIRVARTYDASSKSMDPGRWGYADDLVVGVSVYESLLQYDENQEAVGRLAENYEVSDDQLAYTFHLRKGVQFHHDYGEMTSEDVKFSVERLADPALNATSNYTNIGYENIASIETPDAYTVVFKLREPDVFFTDKMCNNYGFIVSKKAVEEMGLDNFSKLGVGTGPFEFCEGGVIGEKYAVQRFEKYWGEKAKTGRIEVLTIPDDTTLTNAFESGEIDMFDCSDIDLLLKYKSDPKYTVVDSVDKSLLNIGLNAQVEPLNNPKVREAIFCAIDDDMLVNDYFKGLEKKATGVLPAFTKYSVQDYWKPAYDLEKAKKLLAEAGYPNGFSLDYYTVNDTLSLGPATLVEYFLTQLGIDVNFQAVSIGVFKEKVMSGTAPVWSYWNMAKFTPDTTLIKYTSENFPDTNWIGLKDPAYDKAVQSALAENDLDKRADYYAQAQKILMDSNSLYPATTYTCHTCMHADIKGFSRDGLLRTTLEQLYIEP